MDDRRVGRAVVAGVDGSESSLQAVRWAAGEAGRRRVPLRLVAAVGWVTAPHQYGDPRTGPDLREVLLRQARADLADAAQAAAAPRRVRSRSVRCSTDSRSRAWRTSRARPSS